MDLEHDERDRAQRLLDQAEQEIEAIRKAMGKGGECEAIPLQPAPVASVATPSDSTAGAGEPAKGSLQRRLAALAELPD